MKILNAEVSHFVIGTCKYVQKDFENNFYIQNVDVYENMTLQFQKTYFINNNNLILMLPVGQEGKKLNLISSNVEFTLNTQLDDVFMDQTTSKSYVPYSSFSLIFHNGKFWYLER